MYGSESQLVTAVANLAENAVVYSPDGVGGEPPLQVTITAGVNGEFVEIAVTDRGIGIEPKDLVTLRVAHQRHLPGLSRGQ